MVGIGDLQRGDRSGRLLALAPDGPAEQHPEVVSGGWNNPYAFGFSPSGWLWVADNAPGREPERLVGVRPGGQVFFSTELPGPQIAPAGLVALSDSELAICAYLAGQLRLYEVEGGRSRTLAEGCRTGVVELTNGHLAYAGEDEIRVLES